jgi:hypothetical protein
MPGKKVSMNVDYVIRVRKYSFQQPTGGYRLIFVLRKGQ